MRKWLALCLFALLTPMALACAGDDADGEPTATPKPQPSRRGSKLIEGEIAFKGLHAPIAGATITVSLEDVSIQGDREKILVEQVIENVSADPAAPRVYRYLIEHRELEPKESYRLRVLVDVDNSGDVTEGDFVYTANYHATMAVGSETLNTLNALVEPAVVTESDPTESVIRVEAWIEEGFRIEAAPGDTNAYVLKLTSVQPNACARANGYQAVRRLRDEDAISVAVYNVVPASKDIGCAQVVSTTDWEITLDPALEPGADVLFHLNGSSYRLAAGDPPRLSEDDAAPPELPLMRGAIEFVGAGSPIEGESLAVRLWDISRPDLGDRLMTELVIPNFATEPSDPGRYVYAFNYQELRQFGEYVVEAHLDVNGSGHVDAGDYVTTAKYAFTGHSPPKRVNVRAMKVEE